MWAAARRSRRRPALPTDSTYRVSGPPFANLSAAAIWYADWLQQAALPLWAEAGADPATGAFREGLTWSGQPYDPRYRTRVQSRQTFVYAAAALDSLAGPWRAVAERGFDLFLARSRRGDGLFAASLTPDGAPLDPTAYLYEHAFILLAASVLGREALARDVRAALDAFRHAPGGFREAGAEPFQANATMHLFEAALAWEAAGGDSGWAQMADDLAALALDHLLDPTTGAMPEFFDHLWRRRWGEGGLVEPGHQFEWAWLLDQWGARRGRADARAAARRLYDVGRLGFDPARNVAMDALADDLSVRTASARLWPQTEHLKAALILGEREAALAGANGLAAYLATPARGAWRERMRADGGFIVEPSPATSFYHLYLAVRELTRLAGEPC